MLNKKGGIEADLTVSVLQPGSGSVADPSFQERGFYIAAAGGAAYQNLAHITKTVQDKGFNVRLEDKSEDMGMLSLQGPLSRHILAQLTPTPLDNESFPFNSHQMIEVAGHAVRALRVSFVGQMGWELHIPRESCVPVYHALHRVSSLAIVAGNTACNDNCIQVGRQYGMVNAGYRAIDSLSIEKGYPHR